MHHAFWKHLADLGYPSYEAYLRSEHWQDVRRRYRESGRPQRCVGCDNPRYELHHRSYARIGCEHLNDLIPLCRDCHEKVHAFHKAHGTLITHVHVALRAIHRWGKGKAKRKLAPFCDDPKRPLNNFAPKPGERRRRDRLAPSVGVSST